MGVCATPIMDALLVTHQDVDCTDNSTIIGFSRLYSTGCASQFCSNYTSYLAYSGYCVNPGQPFWPENTDSHFAALHLGVNCSASPLASVYFKMDSCFHTDTSSSLYIDSSSGVLVFKSFSTADCTGSYNESRVTQAQITANECFSDGSFSAYGSFGAYSHVKIYDSQGSESSLSSSGSGTGSGGTGAGFKTGVEAFTVIAAVIAGIFLIV